MSKIQYAKWKADEIKAELWILSNKVNYSDDEVNVSDFFCRLAALTFESQVMKLGTSNMDPMGTIGTLTTGGKKKISSIF